MRVGDELATGGGASGPKRFGPDSLRSSCGASGGGFTSLLFFFVFFVRGRERVSMETCRQDVSARIRRPDASSSVQFISPLFSTSTLSPPICLKKKPTYNSYLLRLCLVVIFFCKIDTVVFSLVFDKYYPIMD